VRKDPFAEVTVKPRRGWILWVLAAALLGAVALTRPSTFFTIVVILAFFVMIMLHEFGHFVMAKQTGMKATEFFVGFGPRLWSTRRGETEYGVKAIPLGGYVKIIGMTNLDEVPPEDEPRAYRSKRYWPKFRVAVAGSAMHFLIALVLMFVVLAFAGDLPNQKLVPVVHDVAVQAEGEPMPPAAAAGMEAGDRIVEVDGVPIRTWDDVTDTVSARPGETVPFVVERDGERLTLRVHLASRHPVTGEKRGYAGIAPSVYVPDTNVLTAAVKAPKAVVDVAGESVSALGRVFSPRGINEYVQTLNGENVGKPEANERFLSPVGFGKVAGDAVHAGWVSVLGLLIAINVFVGIFNLLPVLPFDGGHIAIATYEAIASRVRRRKVVVDVQKLMPLTLAVMVVLGFIFLSSVYLDVRAPISNPF
jgi:membrane-associated protease RseP (regulator of RpoE activity)